MNAILANDFSNAIELMQQEIHQVNVDNGFYDNVQEGDVDFMIRASLIHSEVSEFVEAVRESKDKSEHIPQFLAVEEELADIIIRVLDVSAHHHLDLAGAILAKTKFNAKRGYRHGGKAF